MYQEFINFIRKEFRTNDFIPLHAPVFVGNEKKYLNECIDSTFVSSVGKFVDLFEKKVAEYTKSKHAIVCVNGTNALHLSLLVAGVKSGDEVLTQPLTFIATTNGILYSNAIPVFIDVDLDTMGLSPLALKDFLEKNTVQRNGECYNKVTNNRIKACMPMHTFGHACRIDEIAEICEAYNIELVEDAAEGMGSFYKEKHLGTFGRIAAISFNGNKIMTTGGGGIILTDDDELATKAKHLSTQAKVPHQWEYVHDNIGFNYRMPNINAALGLAQLEKLDFFLENKRVLGESYMNFFENKEVTFFKEREEERCNFWLNAILFNNRNERDAFLKESNEAGVMTRPIWQLMNKLPMFENNFKGPLTNSEWLEDRVVNIPSSVRL
ncbi:perosamine synthetase [Tenacibaculum skagerrakense]|uniref:GDP-perosamine synthase n=1 Tax=Tenacibaculum skagerrakense TaxID=186571 RepID=A0A4R2NMV4_9FLAO|nr:LegC family aminotransferase [Tenacibaculum skagerrakense]TCP22911.1 perosamine synthetase [Tenacibaculum skagerrakense]